jgi:hypothetical protein
MPDEVRVAPLVVRPGPAYRVLWWAIVAGALLFGLGGIVQDGSSSYDWAGGILVEVFSAMILAIGISGGTARGIVKTCGSACQATC